MRVVTRRHGGPEDEIKCEGGKGTHTEIKVVVLVMIMQLSFVCTCFYDMDIEGF